jgi:hypothetical protein
VPGLDAQADAGDGVLDFQPRQRQGFVVGDLDRERHLFTEEGTRLAELTSIAETHQTVTLPYSRDGGGQQEHERQDEQQRLAQQQADDQHAADQV